MNTEKIQKALEFATEKHSGQKRKYGGEDYIVHPIEVKEIVERYTNDEDILCACLLHDTIEDTNTTAKELTENFGERVTILVLEVTSPSKEHQQLKRAERKSMDRKHLSNISSDGQTIKYGDILANVPDMIEQNPDKKFGELYVSEKWEDLQVMTKGNSTLRNKAIQMLKDYREDFQLLKELKNER